MIIQCPKCEKKYKIDGEKVTEKGVKVTCQNCSNVIIVRKKPETEAEAQAAANEPPPITAPCIVCGLQATENLDSPNPMCKGCAEAEHGAAGGGFFDAGPIGQKKEIDLSGGKDFSFDKLSGGDFAAPAYSTEMLPENPRLFEPPNLEDIKGLGRNGVNMDESQRPKPQAAPQQPAPATAPVPAQARTGTPAPMPPRQGTPAPQRPPMPGRPGDDKKPK